VIEAQQAIINITATMQVQARRGNTEAEFILKHLPDITKFKR
jgi:hypothetical protein